MTTQIINEKWSEIIEVLHSKYPRDYNGIKNLSFDLHEEQIILHIKSKQLRNSIEQRLLLLTKQAQKVLDNKYVRIGFEVRESAEKKESLYLVKDKYKHYVKKNPQLEKLVSTFNLDL